MCVCVFNPVAFLFFLSKDMKPFLMHDNGSSFLRRTTDVKDKFSGRDGDMNTNFTLQELQTLNAGEWFVRVRTKNVFFVFFLYLICNYFLYFT